MLERDEYTTCEVSWNPGTESYDYDVGVDGPSREVHQQIDELRRSDKGCPLEAYWDDFLAQAPTEEEGGQHSDDIHDYEKLLDGV